VESVVLDNDDESVKAFQDKIMTWWSANARDLPWRREPNPYNVLVSEIMLQQTQVSRVVPKYLEFLQEYPTLEDLAKADTKHLLQVWSGLGYNRRAVWLREAAQSIVEKESFPMTVNELRKLKGIGPYTSRSILIFAFNKDLAAVDTNIRRVFIASGLANEDMNEKQLQEVADTLLLRDHSQDWHNALMDFGSDVMTASATNIAPTSSQPLYNGSIRQIRGAIIPMLTEVDKLTMQEITTNLGLDLPSHIDILSVLAQLIRDGLIEQLGIDEYAIAP